eukprot:scaffold18671_cov54-Phaeocystis_antarctica.AAC.3
MHWQGGAGVACAAHRVLVARASGHSGIEVLDRTLHHPRVSLQRAVRAGRRRRRACGGVGFARACLPVGKHRGGVPVEHGVQQPGDAAAMEELLLRRVAA